jgi:FdhD protein
LRIRVNDVDLVTLLYTPARTNALVLGFLYLEGLINSLDDVALLRVCDEETVAEVRLARDLDVAALVQRRTVTSGCGGGATFGLLDPQRLPPVTDTRTVSPRQIQTLMALLLGAAQAYRVAGGLHASALSDGSQLLAVAEDVGRHNTLDKVMGECLLRGLSPAGHILLTTGRVSSEMLLKAGRMGVPIVASRTSPTDLAVVLARDLNITLVGYVRGSRLNVYTGAERLHAP